MPVRLFFLLLALASPVFAQQAPVRTLDEDDLTIQAFLQAVETAISTTEGARWTDLLSPTADKDQALEFFEAMVPQGITRVVVKERDRSALQGTLPGEGYRLVIEVFMETGPRGRIATWRLDIRRRAVTTSAISRGHPREDRLASSRATSSRAAPEKQFVARTSCSRRSISNCACRLRCVRRRTPEGVTAMVLVGEGTMVFQPAPKEEKGSEIVRGVEALETPFTTAFVRLSPLNSTSESLQRCWSRLRSTAARIAAASACSRRIAESFNLDWSDLSPNLALLPHPGDFVAESRPGFADLTYARSAASRDVTSSSARANATSPRTVRTEAAGLAVSSTKTTTSTTTSSITTSMRRSIPIASGWRADAMKIRITSMRSACSSLRFAEADVSSVYSDEFGRLLFLRVRNQNNLLVICRRRARDFPMTLTVTYAGRLRGRTSGRIDRPHPTPPPIQNRRGSASKQPA